MTIRVACLVGEFPVLAETATGRAFFVSRFLVAERDAAALAAPLGHIATHPEAWPALCAVGRARIERDYDIERLNDRLVALLTDLTHGARDR